MINCIITSPKKTTVYKDIQSVTLPSFYGQTQILPGHAEYFLLLNKGNIILQQSRERKKIIQTPSGECCVKNDNIIIII
ncbi:MAG: hypothetical protein GWO87_01060 [Xanthomonadaceae bacterium]|nr:hypothetical protein [Rhodospirillaceae bacterium]NIA17764.1 hypothetical protein [Xanthomonadaceae bacterium]